jgi:lipoprotein-anchoring transpeptidase ErfK/SrfK
MEVPAPTEESSNPDVQPVDDGSLFPDDGRWIDVNLSQQQVYAYEGNTLVNSFIVSTGLPDTPTVTGEFRIYVKVPLQDMSGPGYYLTDVPWVMFFYEDYGLHGTYWHNNFGTPMSRGCVNLTVEDAAWLYNWASVGTPVSVHY